MVRVVLVLMVELNVDSWRFPEGSDVGFGLSIEEGELDC